MQKLEEHYGLLRCGSCGDEFDSPYYLCGIPLECCKCGERAIRPVLLSVMTRDEV